VKTFFLGAVVGVGCCYISSVIASVIEKAKFLAWIREQGLDYKNADAPSRHALEMAYVFKDVPNTSLEIIDNTKEKEEQEFKNSDIV
jgi:hypothetical protein